MNETEKNYEELTITNNFIFCKVMQSNPNLCKQLVELITGRKICHMVGLNGEQTIEITPDGKGIRLDVYFEDDISDEMKDFLNYLSGKLANSPLTSQLDDAVKLARMNKKWRAEYMLSKIDIDVLKGEYERTIAEKDNELAKDKTIIAEKDARIAELEALLANLTQKNN